MIAGSKEKDHPETALEQFWLELGEGSISANPNMHFFPFMKSLSPSSERPMSTNHTPTSGSSSADHSALAHISQIESLISFYNSAIYGNKKVFMPRWGPEFAFTDPEYFVPHEWTYLYDHSPLVEHLEKYIDYDRLQPNGKPNARLIVTAVNVLTSEPLIFDSSKQRITSKHILATTGYPRYYFRWVEVEKGIYAWDGSLLSNTPLREVIDASPAKDKRVFLVENYPRYSERLPANLLEVEHRVRDIMFCDKTLHNKRIAKAITYYLKFIDELYHVIENRVNLENAQDKEQFERIKAKYKKISERGAQVKGLYYISRDEPFPDLYENADFSTDTIKASIRDGELKAKQALDGYYRNQRNVS
jgi:NTE family protein